MHYVTSDLHGYPLESFKRLLDKTGFSDGDELIVLGDVVDRNGDGGVAMLRFFMGMDNARLIRGNHEDMLLDCKFLFDGTVTPEYFDFKGRERLEFSERLRLNCLARWMRNGFTKVMWKHGNSKEYRVYHKTKWDGHKGKRNGKPNGLNGYVFDISKPPVIDTKTGERGYPGQCIGCRCFLVPIQ